MGKTGTSAKKAQKRLMGAAPTEIEILHDVFGTAIKSAAANMNGGNMDAVKDYIGKIMELEKKLASMLG